MLTHTQMMQLSLYSGVGAQSMALSRIPENRVAFEHQTNVPMMPPPNIVARRRLQEATVGKIVRRKVCIYMHNFTQYIFI